jgi:hypothetical protein
VAFLQELLRQDKSPRQAKPADFPTDIIAKAVHYHVRYYDEQGKFSGEYDLVIEKSGDFYNASWITNGKVSAGGVGMEVKNGLAIGWRRVAD